MIFLHCTAQKDWGLDSGGALQAESLNHSKLQASVSRPCQPGNRRNSYRANFVGLACSKLILLGTSLFPFRVFRSETLIN